MVQTSAATIKPRPDAQPAGGVKKSTVSVSIPSPKAGPMRLRPCFSVKLNGMAITPGLVASLRGKFVVLDGPDGSGKSTQCRRLADALRAAGAELVTCRDPGGTEIGDRIRSVLLDYDLSRMDVNCEALLFMASRAQLVAEVIRPALLHGRTVLCDRFVSSTCAYQGAAGMDAHRVIDLASFAVVRTWPDVTIVIDIDVETGMRRIEAKLASGRQGPAPGKDAMERRPMDFHRRVRAAFLELPRYYPAPVLVVPGDATEDVVHTRVLGALSTAVGQSGPAA
jgi:dTMP kinase